MSYHWRSSDARELFEKTVLRRVSLLVLVVLSLSPVSTGRLEIDQHCLHGQYHSLFTDNTCVKPTCPRVINADRQPYTVTQEDLPSANRLSLGYSLSFWIKVDTTGNYTNRHLISLTDSHGTKVWEISMNGINGKRKSKTVSLVLKSKLSHISNTLLSVRLSTNQQSLATWHNVLLSFHSNGQIIPYFDGFVGQHQWIPLVNNGNYSIILGARQNKHKFNLQYKDPLLFTRSLSEAEVVGLQQNEISTNVAMYSHCLCPDGYRISFIDQNLCESDSGDTSVSYLSRINGYSADETWLQYNKRLKRADNSDDIGSGMDTSIVASTLLLTPSSAVIMTSSVIPSSEFIGSGDSTSELPGSGFSTSDTISIISFTSTVSPLSSPPIISSTIPTETSSPTTRSMDVTQTTISSIVVVSSTFDTSAVSSAVSSTEVTPTFTSILTSAITPSFTVTSIAARNTTASVVLSSSITPSFVTPSFVTPSLVTPSFVTPSFVTPSFVTPSLVTPSFTMTINESSSITFTTVVPSSINVTSAVVSTPILISSSEVTFSSQVGTSSVIVTSFAVSSTTSTLFTSVIISSSSIIPVTSVTVFPTMVTSSVTNVTSRSTFVSPSSSTEISSLVSSTTTETMSLTIATSRGIDSTSVIVSSTILVSTESIITPVTTSSLAVTVTPTSIITMFPTVITTGVIESTNIAPSSTLPISSSSEIIPNTTIMSFSEPSTPLRVSTLSPILSSTEIFTTILFSSTEIVPTISSTLIEVSSTMPLVTSVISSLSSEVLSTITPISVISSVPVISTINMTPLPSSEVPITTLMSSSAFPSDTTATITLSLTSLPSSITSDTTEFSSTIMPSLTSLPSSIISDTTEFSSTIMPSLTSLPSSITSDTTEFSSTIMPSLTSLPSSITSDTTEFSSTIMPSLTSLPSSIISDTTEFSSTIMPSLTSLPSSITSDTTEFSSTIMPSLTSLPPSIISDTTEFSSTIMPSLTSLPSSITSDTTEFSSTIMPSLTSLPPSITSDTTEFSPTMTLSLTSNPIATSISITESIPTLISSASSSVVTLVSSTELISSTEITPTFMITSTIVESTLEVSSPSLVASTTLSSLVISSTMSSIEISPTMTSRTDITSMSMFTLTSVTASIPESSFISTPVSSTESLSISSAVETVSVTLVPTSEFSSSTVDTTATVISSVVISPSFTSVSVIETNSSTFTPALSDTVSVTLSTVSSSQLISTVETMSSMITPSSTTDFTISSTFTEVMSSTSLFPSSEVTQSSSFVSQTSPVSSMSIVTIMSSSVLVVSTTTTLMVSPTPTMVPCPPDTKFCEILMECIHITQECPDVPKAPIRVSVEGPGFLVNEINQNESDNSQYTFNFGNFINAQMYGSEGKIVFNVGSRQDSVNFAIPQSQISYDSLTGHIIQKKVAPNETINVIVQARNLNLFNTNEESLTIVILGNDIKQDVCTITSEFGYCIGSFNAPREAPMINISAMEQGEPTSNIYYIDQVEVIQYVEDTGLNPAIIIRLPTHTIYPPDNVTVTVSSRGYEVKSLLLDCSLNDSSASITALPRPNWSTLSINNNDNKNELAISHERLIDVKYESEEEILSMEINFENYITDWIEVNCQITELLTTNGVLMNTEDVNIIVVDRDNTSNSSHHIFLAEDNVTYLIAYSDQTEIFNSAVINGEPLMVDLIVKGITMTGRVEDLNISSLSCDSSNSNVLKVTNCSTVILDGTETTGSSSVAINVHYGPLSTNVSFKVWYPERLVIKAEDMVLNAIANWPDPDLNCSHKYQQTAFRVFANLSDGSTTINELDVTSYVSSVTNSSNASVLKVLPNATVEGVSEGTADIVICNYSLTINVSNDLVRAATLEVMLFNNIDIDIAIPETFDLYDDIYGTITLAQKNDREKFLYVNVLFNDSQRMELNQSQFTIDNTCPDNIAVRGNSIHPIGNTNGAEECIKVTLMRDKMCNFSDSVEGMANVSIQLSTPDHLIINQSPDEIIADHNISLITGISTEITIKVILNFTDGDQIDITLSNETIVTTDLNLTRSSTNLIITASPSHKNTKYNLTITNSLYNNISTSIMVNVVQNVAISLSAHPYPLYNGSYGRNENNLSQISTTGKYQQAILRVWLTLPNGSKYDVTDQVSFSMSPNSALIISNDTDKVVRVNDDMVNPNVNITAQFNSLYSSITIQVTPQPVELESIDNVDFEYEFRGVRGSTRFVDVSVTLDDNTVLLSTYYEGNSLYPGLLSFNLTDSTSASIEGNIVTLLGNSLMPNYITAFANNLSSRAMFWGKLEAGLHDVDLGNNLDLPIAFDENDSFIIPVHVNSENTNLGIVELNVLYSSERLSIANVIPGDDWTTGSLEYQVTVMDDNTEKVNFGGINYNGKQGSSIHVANVMFMPKATGDVILNSTITLLAKADFNSTLLGGEEERSSIAGSSLMIKRNQQKKRRDIFYDELPLMSPPLPEQLHHQHKRQSCEEFPPGDLNQDCRVNLRDVNYLRHYQVESVYNFTSENGKVIQMTYNTTESLTEGLDINGDGQVNSLDITELEDISFDLLRIISNVNATCFPDNGACACVVTGELSTADNQQFPSDYVYILVDFASTNASFQEEFDTADFETGTKVLDNKENHSYGGVVQAAIEGNMFMVKTNYSFRTPDTGISLIQITFDTNGETSDERKSIHVRPGNIYSPLNIIVPIVNMNVSISSENHYSPLMNLTNDCPVISTSTTTLSTTTIESTSTMMIMSSSAIDSSSTTSTSSLSVTATESVTTAITDTSSTTISQLTSISVTPPTPTVMLSSTVITSEASTTSSSEISTISITSDISPSTPTMIISSDATASTANVTTESTSAGVTFSTMTVSPTTVENTTSTVASTSTMLTSTTSSMIRSSITTTIVDNTTSTGTSTVDTIVPTMVLPLTSSMIASSSITAAESTTSITAATSTTTASTTVVSSTTSVVGSSNTITTSETSTTSPSSSIVTTTVGSGGSSGGGGGGSGGVIAGVIIPIIAIVVAVTVIVICWYRRSKRRKTYYIKQESRPSSGLSSNYWFQEEEKIEMSPIDIVPVAPSACDERFEDTLTVPNGHGIGYRNIGYASGTQRSMDGGTKPNGYFKPSAESSAGPPPPPYTSRQQRRPDSTAFDDELILSFYDEPPSQAYLSLGLTPLSQLSPPDSQEVGFFPSIPPPLGDDHSISVDGPLYFEDNKKFPRRNRKAGLETVPEQPSSMSPSRRYSDGSHVVSPFQRSTQQDESFVFPSANISQDYLRPLSGTNRSTNPSYGAQNPAFSAQYEDDPLIDFNEFSSGYSIHVDSTPESRLNGRDLNYHSASIHRESPPEEHQSQQFTRRDQRRQLVKRSRGDLSQRLSQEMMPRQLRKEKVYYDEDGDTSTSLLPRPTSPPGVYPPQFSDEPNKFTPPVKDYGSVNSLNDFKEDHASTLL